MNRHEWSEGRFLNVSVLLQCVLNKGTLEYILVYFIFF